MNLFLRLERWGDSHHSKWLDIIRIVLGIFLVYKGIDVLKNMSAMISMMSTKMSFGSFAYVLAAHYAVFAHVLGGLLLIMGLLTRFACLIQIPVLLGAIFFISTNKDMLRPYSELFLSIIVLLLLIYFLIVGNGPWSLSRFVDQENRKGERLSKL